MPETENAAPVDDPSATAVAASPLGDDADAQPQLTFKLSAEDLVRVHRLQHRAQARVGTSRRVWRAEILREVVAAGLNVLECEDID